MKLSNSISFGTIAMGEERVRRQSESPKYKESDYADILNKQYSTPEEIEADHDRFVSSNYDISGLESDKEKYAGLIINSATKDVSSDFEINMLKNKNASEFGKMGVAILLSAMGLMTINAKQSVVKFNQTMDNVAKNLGIVAKDVTGDGKKDFVLPQNETDNVVVDFEKRELTFNETHENGKVFTSKEKFDDFFEAAGLMYGEQENGNDFFFYYNTDKDFELDGKIKSDCECD